MRKSAGAAPELITLLLATVATALFIAHCEIDLAIPRVPRFETLQSFIPSPLRAPLSAFTTTYSRVAM
jgi:hypothetical protein